MFKSIFVRIKWWLKKRYQVNPYRLEEWAMEILDEYDFDERTIIEFANRCRLSKDFVRYGKDGNVLNGMVYGSCGVYEDDVETVIVTYFLGNFQSYYRQKYGQVKHRWLYEFIHHKKLKRLMQEKMRVTLAHEYRHSVQQWYLLDHGINLVDMLDKEQAALYGAGIMEEDAMRYSEEGVDIPMEEVFKGVV